MNIQFIEALANEDASAVRYTFKAVEYHDVFIVVKFINQGERNSASTVKVWNGKYESTKKRWNTRKSFNVIPNDLRLAIEQIDWARTTLDNVLRHR